MRLTWTRFEDARPIDLYSSLCFIAMVSVGAGLIVQISFVDGHGPWVLAFVVLYRLHRRVSRAAERPDLKEN